MGKVIANYHTHTTVCDGKNTPEETVLAAIDRGFTALGFSSHGYTPFDLRYCMHDTDAYINEIARLKKKYKGRIEIYLGAEEDCRALVDRNRFEYIIGSCHYFHLGGKYLPIDSGIDYFRACLEAFEFNTHRLAETYYSEFCSYILSRKPDIVGHFDLITKFDEMAEPIFLNDPKYKAIAEKYLRVAIGSGCIFEVNTGAISRGYRKSVYPSEDLLYVMKKEGVRITLSSDSHAASTLDCAFDETRKYLYGIGFRHAYALRGKEFLPYEL